MRHVLKNIFLCCTFLGLIVACETPPKIQGVWGEVYTVNANGQKAFYGQKQLFDFEGDSLKVIWIGNEQNGKIHETHLFKTAILEKNPWRYTAIAEDSSDYILSVVSKDSLVLSSSHHQQQIVLKPLERNYNKPYRPANLTGKAYKSVVQGLSCILDFVDKDFMIITIGDHIEKIQWSLVNYKGYQFLDNTSFYLLQTLRLNSEGLLFLTNYHVGTNTNTYSPITPAYRKEQLYGSWLKDEGSPIISMPYGPDRQSGIEFNEDYLIRHAKVLDAENWQLSNDGAMILLPGAELRGYKILELTDSSLLLQDLYSEPVMGHTSSGTKGPTIHSFIKGEFDF